MWKIAIFILLMTYVSCTLAHSFDEICALSRDQLSQFTDCLDDFLSDESRDVVRGFLECLGFSSIFDYLENECAFQGQGLDPTDDMVKKFFSCYMQYAENLNTVLTKENENYCLEKATAEIVE
ncbi:uncharacterized protein [Centruroides vittatus]|uniref:uncharacterized protein n=1 Tax=Centruroides vittatus TaxID=120091 RepID=UPI00350EA561